MASIKFVCPACNSEHIFPLFPGTDSGRWITILCPEKRENINVRIVVQAKLAPSFDNKDLDYAMDAEYKNDEKWREEERTRVREDEYRELFGKDGEKKDERQ